MEKNKLNVFQLEAIKEEAAGAMLMAMLREMGADQKVLRFFKLLTENGVAAETILNVMIALGKEEVKKDGE